MRGSQPFLNKPMTLIIPKRLAATCQWTSERKEWLARLPALVRTLARGFSLRLDVPFDCEEMSCAWVAPASLAHGGPAVLKISMPHMEAELGCAAGTVIRQCASSRRMTIAGPCFSSDVCQGATFVPRQTPKRMSSSRGYCVVSGGLRLWTFARVATEPRQDGMDDSLVQLARRLAL